MASVREQLALEMKYSAGLDSGLRDAAASENKSLPIHRWVPWSAGFSAQFVQDAIEKYLPRSKRTQHVVLDPFAGVGTTLVEAIKSGNGTIGFEINPFAALVAAAKIACVEVSPSDFRAEIDAFRSAMQRFETEVDRRYTIDPKENLLDVGDLKTLRPAQFKSRIPFFSPPVEAKFLYALLRTGALLEPDRTLFRAALGATMVSYSNYTYEPSLASRPGSGKALIENASVALTVCRKLDEMVTDIEWARQTYGYNWLGQTREVRQSSYFDAALEGGSISLVVTSPPYMNNYHYVRNTRPQLYWLGLLANGGGNQLEHASFGKFWQTVRQGERVDLTFDLPGLRDTLAELRSKHPEKRQYGGTGWANYVATYLNDSFRFMKSLRMHLKVGGHAVIVIGNSIIQALSFRSIG
jgi:hypothetical protein